MKILFLFSSLLLIIIFDNCTNLADIEEKNTATSKVKIVKNITFILGEDKEKDNPYYHLAEEYYRYNPNTADDELVTDCKSLKSVKDYLNANLKDNTIWGKINLVTHSNEWRGLAVPVFDDGERANFNLLNNAIKSGKFSTINPELLDSSSEIIIQGCGFGKNKRFLSTMKSAFGVPNISASNYFIVYQNLNDTPVKYEADYYYAFFKTGYRPANIILGRQFKKRYPEITIDWVDALSRTQSRYIGDSYNYFFNVPIKWVVTYPTKKERPQLISKKEKMNWLKTQTELLEIIAKTNIPINKFRWQFKNINYTFKDGITEPAIEIKGKVSVMCVLRGRTL